MKQAYSLNTTDPNVYQESSTLPAETAVQAGKLNKDEYAYARSTCPPIDYGRRFRSKK
jgi:hypothetical protein